MPKIELCDFLDIFPALFLGGIDRRELPLDP